MASIVFSESYYVSYVGDVSANVRLTFDESYTASTNKSVVTLSKIEVQVAGNSVTYPSLPMYGVIKLAGTTVATIDNTQGGKMASVTISGSGYCQADISKLTITPVTVEHNADGTKDVTVQLTGGYTASDAGGNTYFCALYTYYHGTPPHSLVTTYVPFGVKTSASKAMSLTSHTRQWTVSYNANGHGTAPASQTKTYGTNLTLRSFISDQTGTGTKATYTITGNANGSSWSGSNGSASKTPNYTYSQTYWNTKSDGTGTNYSSGGTYSSNAAATMYAQWSTSTSYSYTYTLPTGTPTKNQSRSVTFNANGGTGAPAAQSSSRAMTFNGWYTAASGGTKRTTSSQVSAAETVYAQFGNGTANYPSITLSTTKPTKASSSLEGYWTTFNANGGTCSTSQLRSARTQVFTFSKWNTAANGSGTNYNSGGTYSSNSAATLYAQYSSSITVAPITLPTPTRSGYGFTGWYTAASGGTKIGNAGASYTPSTDATVYAQWTAQASTIASCSSSVETTNNLALTVSRNSTAFYHKATFKIGSTTLATSSAFATSLSYTVPRTWFNSYPNDTSKTVTVSVQTYTDSNCTTTVGSAATTTFTMTADAGMKPSVTSGWATASAYNTGTAAANISGFVKGYSKAQITFNANKITMANNATIASYSVTCLGSTDGSSPYLTPVLNATSVSVVCTVADSRGRTASETLTISVMDYVNPKISGVSVYRCDSSGTADDDGTYYSVKATATVSSLNNQNTGTLTGALAAAGGSYGTAYSLTSGTRAIKGTISADTSYSVKLTVTDSLGNTTTYYARIPTRKWAMKFRPTGNGVAFGKAAEYDNAFEVNPDWYIRHGANNGYVPTVRTGYLGSGDYYDITGALAFIVLSYSSSHFAIYNCLGDSITRLAGTATSSVVKQDPGYRVTNTATIGTLRYFILTVL